MMKLEVFQAEKFIAILRRIPRSRILKCAEAAYSGGVRLLEITFDPSDPETLTDTAEKVRMIRERFPDTHIGCGTVLNTGMVAAADGAGAEFILSPNTSIAVIGETRRRGMRSIPGAFTPCEIVTAYEAGADLVKLFPIRPGEESYVRNVMSPLSHIPFLVTGGVTPETIRAMLSTGASAVAAGASLFRPELVEAEDYAEIRRLAKAHLEAV